MLLAHYLKLKGGPVIVKKKQDVWPSIFLQVKNECWIGFRLQKQNSNDDSFVPFKP